MKKINIPTAQHEIDLINNQVASLEARIGILKGYPKPYDRILVLKSIKKDINRTLKATNN